MNKIIVNLLAFSLIVINAQAQSTAGKIFRNFKLGKVQATAGVHMDRYNRMTKAMMYDFTKNPGLIKGDFHELGEGESWERNNHGSGFGLNFSLLPTGDLQDLSSEIKIGLAFCESEPVISRYEELESTLPGMLDTSVAKSTMLCRAQKDFLVAGEYLLKTADKGKPIGKFLQLRFYAGLGASFAVTSNKIFYDDKITKSYMDTATATDGNVYSIRSIDSEGTSNFETGGDQGKTSVISRVYAPVGVELTFFRHFEFSLNGTVGTGVEKVMNGRSYFMPVNVGVKTGLAWRF